MNEHLGNEAAAACWSLQPFWKYEQGQNYSREHFGAKSITTWNFIDYEILLTNRYWFVVYITLQ